MNRKRSSVKCRRLWPALALLLGWVAPAAADAPNRYEGTWRVVAVRPEGQFSYAVIKIAFDEQRQIQLTVLDTLTLQSPNSAIIIPVKVKSANVAVDNSLLKIVIHTSVGDWNVEGVLGNNVDKRIRGSLRDEETIQAVFLVPTDSTSLTADDKMKPIDIPTHREFLRNHNPVFGRPLPLRYHDLEEKKVLVQTLQKQAQTMAERMPRLLETLRREQPNSPVLIDDAVYLLHVMGKVAFKADQFQKWISVAEETAEYFGPALKQETRIQIGTVLVGVNGAEQFTLEYARSLEKSLLETDPVSVRVGVLKVLGAALKQVGKTDEARSLQPRIDILEQTLDSAFSARVPPLKPATPPGRLGKHKRVAVVELWTNSQERCCQPVQVALAALEKSYPPDDLVQIQYHVQLNRTWGDPLANPEAQARWNYYSDVVLKLDRRSFYQAPMPAVLCNGKKLAVRASADFGSMAGDYLDGCSKEINALLEQDAEVNLTAVATLKGNRVHIQAEVKELNSPAVSKRLRLILVEDTVRYRGASAMRLHHQVCRAFAGGVDGFPLTARESKWAVTVNLDDLREKLVNYLDDYNWFDPFNTVDRPLALTNLRLIALVQDDKAGTILQAIRVDVPAASGK